MAIDTAVAVQEQTQHAPPKDAPKTGEEKPPKEEAPSEPPSPDKKDIALQIKETEQASLESVALLKELLDVVDPHKPPEEIDLGTPQPEDQYKDLTAAELAAKLDKLPHETAALGTLSKEFLDEIAEKILPRFQSLTIGSIDDIQRQNTLLNEVIAAVKQVRDNHEAISNTRKTHSALVNTFIPKFVQEHGFDDYSAVHHKQNQLERRLQEFETSRTKRILRAREYHQLKHEKASCDRVIQTVDKYLNAYRDLPSQAPPEQRNELFKLVGETTMVTTDRILGRQEALFDQLKQEGSSPELDQETLQSVHNQYIDVYIKDFLNTLKVSNPRHALNPALLEDPTLIKRTGDILRESAKGSISQEDLARQIAELPKPFDRIAEDYKSYRASDSMQEIAVMTTRLPHLATQKQQYESYKHIVDAMQALPLYSRVSYETTDKIRRRILESGIHTRGGEKIDGEFPSFSFRTNVSLWNIFRDNPKVLQQLGKDKITALDTALMNIDAAQAYTSIRFSADQQRGTKLLYFTDSFPAGLLLAVSRSNSKELFLPDADGLHKALSELSDERLEAVKALPIPGLAEAITLMQQHPSDFDKIGNPKKQWPLFEEAFASYCDMPLEVARKALLAYREGKLPLSDMKITIRDVLEDPDTSDDARRDWSEELTVSAVNQEFQSQILRMALHTLNNQPEDMQNLALDAIAKLTIDISSSYAPLEQLFASASTQTQRNIIKTVSNNAVRNKNSQGIDLTRKFAETATDDDMRNYAVYNIAQAAQEYREALGGSKALQQARENNDPFYKTLETTLDSLLQAEAQESKPDTLLHLLKAFDALDVNTQALQELYSSGRIKEHLDELIAADSQTQLIRIFKNRLTQFNDESIIDVMFTAVHETSDTSFQASIIRAFASEIETTWEENPASSALKIKERVFADLAGEDLTAARIASDVIFSIDHDAIDIDDLSKPLTQEFREEIRGLLEKDDPVMQWHGYIKAGQIELQFDKPSMLYTIALKGNELQAYNSSYPRSLVQEIEIAMQQDEFTNQQINNMFKNNHELQESTMAITYALQGRFDPETEAAILAGRAEFTAKRHAYAQATESIGELSEENTMQYLVGYVLGQDNFTPALALRFGEAFDAQDSKDLAYKAVRKLWHSFLNDPQRKHIPLSAVILGATIGEQGGAGHLKYVESLTKLMHQFETTRLDPHTAQRTRNEIKDGLKSQERRFTEERWSDTDKTFFYDISSDILKASPSMYVSFLETLSDLSPQEMKQFTKDFLPLYQAKLILGQSADTSVNPRTLLSMRTELRTMKKLLQEAGRENREKRKAIFADIRTTSADFLKSNFTQRFGLLKVPEQFDEEHLRTLQNFIRYLGNINDRDQQKELLVSFFMGMKLNGDWEKFRRGETIDLTQYFDGEKAQRIQTYLAEREQSDILTTDQLRIPEASLAEFQESLQEETINRITGHVETIDVKLEIVRSNIRSLADPDALPAPEERGMLSLYIEQGKEVGRTLALAYQQSNGKNVTVSAGQAALLKRIEELYGGNPLTGEAIAKIQESTKGLSLIATTVRSIESEELQQQIDGLRQKMTPSRDIVAIFNKLGEEFTSASGAQPVSQDLQYLENIARKGMDKMTPDEQKTVREYLGGIHNQMQVLEQRLTIIQEQFVKIKESTHAQPNTPLRQRLDELESILTSKSTETEIITTVTNDFNLIIENMRQCLGCLSKEINNDTNLTFGDRNKFHIISQKSGEKGSIADEIAFFVPVTFQDGRQEVSFVLDNVYGAKSPDVLLNHVMAVAKKYRQIKDRFPESTISIIVSQPAMSGTGTDPVVLMDKIKETMPTVQLSKEDVLAHLPASAVGDHYVEFGGSWGRVNGDISVSGLVLRI